MTNPIDELAEKIAWEFSDDAFPRKLQKVTTIIREHLAKATDVELKTTGKEWGVFRDKSSFIQLTNEEPLYLLFADIDTLTLALAARDAEIARLKVWKDIGSEYSECLQKLCMDVLYENCKPASRSWPGRKHTDTIVEGVDFLLAEIARLKSSIREHLAKATDVELKTTGKDWDALREICKSDPDIRLTNTGTLHSLFADIDTLLAALAARDAEIERLKAAEQNRLNANIAKAAERI